MNTRISLKTLLIFVILILSVYSVFLTFTILGQMEVPSWLLQSTSYAIMTVVLTGILAPLFIDYLKNRKLTKIKKKKALKSLKNEYKRCARSISDNLDKHVMKNEMPEYEIVLSESWVMGESKISEELNSQVQKFNKKQKDYNIFCKYSKPLITTTIQKEVRNHFPKTSEKSDDVKEMLCSDFIMERYFNGEKVTTTWFRETHVRTLKNITKDINESERDDIDLFFNSVNAEFQKNDFLVRFRKEKKELIELGQAILKDLKEEVKKLQKELEEYKDVEEEMPKMTRHPYS